VWSMAGRMSSRWWRRMTSCSDRSRRLGGAGGASKAGRERQGVNEARPHHESSALALQGLATSEKEDG
jgi:hypothetical protein